MILKKIIKNISFTTVYLLAINIFLEKIGYNIPLNLFSFSIVYFFKFPGLILLLFLSRW